MNTGCGQSFATNALKRLINKLEEFCKLIKKRFKAFVASR